MGNVECNEADRGDTRATWRTGVNCHALNERSVATPARLSTSLGASLPVIALQAMHGTSAMSVSFEQSSNELQTTGLTWCERGPYR